MDKYHHDKQIICLLFASWGTRLRHLRSVCLKVLKMMSTAACQQEICKHQFGVQLDYFFFAHIWESNEGSREFIVGALQWFWGKRMEAIGNMHRSARISISFGPPLPGNSFWPGNRWSQDWTASKPTQRRFFRHETVLIGKGAIRYTNITKTNTTHTESIPSLGSKITLESSCVVRKQNQGALNTENWVSPYWRSFLEKCAIFPFDAQGSRERSDESFQSKATGSVKGPRHWITDRILPAFWFQTKMRSQIDLCENLCLHFKDLEAQRSRKGEHSTEFKSQLKICCNKTPCWLGYFQNP